MRHLKKKITLDRKKAQRDALIRTQIISLISDNKITTTKAKATAVKNVIEKLITIAKNDNINSLRLIIRRIHNERAAKKLLKDIAPKYKNRNGGYIRLYKVGFRVGDGSQLMRIEFV